MFGREPVLLAAAIAAIAQGVWMVVANDATVSTVGIAQWLVPVITLLGGLFGRSKVMPVKTIEQAGLTSDGIKARAGAEA